MWGTEFIRRVQEMVREIDCVEQASKVQLENRVLGSRNLINQSKQVSSHNVTGVHEAPARERENSKVSRPRQTSLKEKIANAAAQVAQ